MLLSYADVEAASARIENHVLNTPVLSNSAVNSFANAGRIFLKCENLQHGGSFKARGAYNAICMLPDFDKARGVVAFSSGNHALGVSMAAKELGVPAVIVMPRDAPCVKIEGTRANDAEIILYDRINEDREAICRDISRERGMTLIPPFDHPGIIAGQGTIAKELFETAGELDYLFVCCGGAGMLAGCVLAAAALCPSCLVYGVEPEAGNDAQQSFEAGRIVKISTPATIADGAQSQYIGNIPFDILKVNKSFAGILTVSDAQLLVTLRFFAEKIKLVVEPTGCLALAGAKYGGIDLTDKRVGVVVSGGNVDIPAFTRHLLSS
jgi:threonine dehydratase